MGKSKRFRILVNDYPDYFDRIYEPFLFNQSKYIGLIKDHEQYSFYLVDDLKQLVLAEITFLVNQDFAVSIPSSPFGGFSIHSITYEQLTGFIQHIELQLNRVNVNRIFIKNPANIYHPEHNALVLHCLLNQGFKILHTEINHHLLVGNHPFEEGIHSMEKRKLKKLRSSGFQFETIIQKNMQEVYNFIRDCRVEKKLKINITWKKLQDTMRKCTGRYKGFKVIYENKIVAATIGVVVGNDIFYNYLPASPEAFRKESPMVMLMEGLWNYCQQNDIKILDLGIASIEGQPQKGLIQFKERISGQTGLKTCLQKLI